jgi:2-phosphosulfolactate phosphatase
MLRTLHVYALPTFAAPEDFIGGTVVVIDVLRATTTIVFALEAGATEVIPCLEVSDARAIAETFPPETAVLGGERNGLPIEGFDLGNSPAEYTPETVGGKTVIFTTTNGTRAMLQCRKASEVFLGAFVNVSAVYQRLLGRDKIHLLCSGTRGQFGRDDILLAGLLVHLLQCRAAGAYQLNAQAITAREDWISAFAVPFSSGAEPLSPELLAGQLRNSPGGRNLASNGLEADILAAARIDCSKTVPELDPESLRIRGWSGT